MSKLIRRLLIDPLEFMPLFLMFVLFKLLPVRFSSWLGGRLACLICPHLPVHKIGEQNLKAAFPKWSSAKRQTVLKEAWENLGRVVGEFPHVNHIANSRVVVVDHCDLDALEQSDSSRIFFSAHMANWEIPHLVLTRRKMKIALLSRPPNNWVTRWFFKCVRHNPLVDIILKGSGGSKAFLRTLQGGKNMGILLDQRLSEGAPVPFFGRPALTPTNPSMLAKRFGAIMVPVQVERLPNVQFRITYHKPMKVPTSPTVAAEKINKVYEDWITAHPDQWLWFHNRWKG